VETEKKEQNRLRQAEESRQRLALKQAEKQREEDARMLSRLEQQELAKQKEREFEELRKTWAIVPGDKKTDRKKKKQPKQDAEDEAVREEDSEPKRDLVFSDSESEVKSASGDEADVFGSSSEDEPSLGKRGVAQATQPANVDLYDSDEDVAAAPLPTASGNLRRKRPADELDEENEDEVFSSTKGDLDSVPQMKQRRVVDDEEDGEAEADF
jgi:hypothetical protein